MNKRIGQVAFLCLLGFLFGTGAAWHTVNKEVGAGVSVAQIEPAAGAALAGAAIGGSFTLIDHNGNSVTEEDYSASYKLVYFGFTFCPEICPTELQKMASVLNTLGQYAEGIQPLFVSTDPERDTPDVMKSYVEMFHPRLVGLTGSLEQIKAVQDSYKVYAAKVEDPALSDYTMNHSSYMFLMTPDDKPLALFSVEDTPADVAQQIEAILEQL